MDWIKKIMNKTFDCAGNYMNSSKRGPAYGFKLSSLDNLGDTKSPKKKISLLHFIQDTVRNKLPEINNFDSDLRGIESAAQGEFFIVANIKILVDKSCWYLVNIKRIK